MISAPPGLLHRLLSFLSWFAMDRQGLRADLLAGLPVVYGLYAAFIPVIVASLWGSPRQLRTGPTATLSLMVGARP